jgi:uncharacterized phiE125 gp8 family phage protein
MIDGVTEPIVTLPEAQAFARLETGEEEALVAGLIRTASGLCEAFLRQVVIERAFAEQLRPSGDWQRLTVVPVRSIDSATQDGAAVAAGSYATDIDASGCGWIRFCDPSVTGTVTISGLAGMASGENAVPEPIRHGVLRLVAHLFAHRDSEGGDVPAAVSALWRPYRRLALA